MRKEYSVKVRVRQVARHGWVPVLTAFALWWNLFPPSADSVEAYYSRGLYRLWAALVPPITEALPFSLALVLLIGLLAGGPIALVWAWWREARRGLPLWRRSVRVVWRVAVTALILYVWFVVLWGAGYARPPAEVRLALDPAQLSAEQRTTLQARLLQTIVVNAPAPGIRDVDGAIAAIAEAMVPVVAAWDGRPIRLPRRVKATPPGFLLIQASGGVCSPFTLEPHVDGAYPPTVFVYVAAHELGHVAGFNAEAEATLAGFVAGLRADHPYARYAVALDAYLDVVRVLPMPAQQRALAILPQAAKDDLAAARKVRDRHGNRTVQATQRRVYNQYLKAQGIQEGVANYARGIRLFAQVWRDGVIDLPGLEPAPGG